mgnify:CR=1 FL=1
MSLILWQTKYVVASALVLPFAPLLYLQGQLTRRRVGLRPAGRFLVRTADRREASQGLAAGAGCAGAADGAERCRAEAWASALAGVRL